MATIQNFGIKFPFTRENNDNHFLDLNKTESDAISSELIHLILTPKGQRLRLPDFGTDLIKYIFDPSDSLTWDNVKNEIVSKVSFYMPSVTLTNIEILSDSENEQKISIKLNYLVKYGSYYENKEQIVNL